MPRVSQKKKNKAGKAYPCGRCAETIKAGETYFEWSFRYGGTRRQHTTHGRPRPSQLTQSKMSGVHAAIESVEDAIANARTSKDASDLAQALNDAASEVENVRDEYQDGLSNMPDGLQQSNTGQQIQEKIDALDSFKDELESCASDCEWDASEEYENEDAKDQALEDLCSKADDAVGSLAV